VPGGLDVAGRVPRRLVLSRWRRHVHAVPRGDVGRRVACGSELCDVLGAVYRWVSVPFGHIDARRDADVAYIICKSVLLHLQPDLYQH
jgi:hypothetical protein